MALPKPWRRHAGIGLAAYLIAVFPGNVYVAVADVDVEGQPGGAYPWLRLPLRTLFIAWALWSTRGSGLVVQRKTGNARTRTSISPEHGM